MSDFKAAIRWLNSGIASQTKAEKKFWKEHPFVPPTDDESFRAAIRVLEAAGKMDKREMEYGLSLIEQYCEENSPLVVGYTALLAALPDEEASDGR